jgi:hypothetical protein
MLQGLQTEQQHCGNSSPQPGVCGAVMLQGRRTKAAAVRTAAVCEQQALHAARRGDAARIADTQVQRTALRTAALCDHRSANTTAAVCKQQAHHAARRGDAASTQDQGGSKQHSNPQPGMWGALTQAYSRPTTLRGAVMLQLTQDEDSSSPTTLRGAVMLQGRRNKKGRQQSEQQQCANSSYQTGVCGAVMLQGRRIKAAAVRTAAICDIRPTTLHGTVMLQGRRIKAAANKTAAMCERQLLARRVWSRDAARAQDQGARQRQTQQQQCVNSRRTTLRGAVMLQGRRIKAAANRTAAVCELQPSARRVWCAHAGRSCNHSTSAASAMCCRHCCCC